MLLDGMFEEEVAVFPARNAFYFRLLGAQAAATAIDAMAVGISLCAAGDPTLAGRRNYRLGYRAALLFWIRSWQKFF